MTKATIYDVSRMCRTISRCENCGLYEKHNGRGVPCEEFIVRFPNDANEIIVGWCEDNPPKTRQSEMLQLFPNVRMIEGVVGVCPRTIDETFECTGCLNEDTECEDCYKEYWLAEVEE